MTNSPSGWYPDPTSPAAQLRYWDGTSWTEHRAPGAPTPQLAGPTTPDGEPLAGWGWRLLAYLIDSVVLSVVTSILTIPAQLRFQRGLEETLLELDPTADFTTGMDAFLGVFQDFFLWLILPSVMVSVAYFAVMWRWRGATVGQLALGLRVRLRERPGTLPWSAIAARIALFVVLGNSLAALAFASGSWAIIMLLTGIGSLFQLLNGLWPLWDDKRQALHDKAARTNVVKVR